MFAPSLCYSDTTRCKLCWSPAVTSKVAPTKSVVPAVGWIPLISFPPSVRDRGTNQRKQLLPPCVSAMNTCSVFISQSQHKLRGFKKRGITSRLCPAQNAPPLSYRLPLRVQAISGDLERQKNLFKPNADVKTVKPNVFNFSILAFLCLGTVEIIVIENDCKQVQSKNKQLNPVQSSSPDKHHHTESANSVSCSSE